MDTKNVLTAVPKINQLDIVPASIDQNIGSAFGLSVKEKEGISLVSGDVKDINSILFKDAGDSDFITVLSRNELMELRNQNPQVFAELYSARPVGTPEEGVLTRGWAVISGTVMTYLVGSSNDTNKV